MVPVPLLDNSKLMDAAYWLSPVDMAQWLLTCAVTEQSLTARAAAVADPRRLSASAKQAGVSRQLPRARMLAILHP